MILYITWVINFIAQLITLLVIIKVFLSYFMSPYHPVRMMIDRIVDPMLYPIKRVLPSVGMLDLSPIVLIIIVQILNRIIISLLTSLIR